MALTEKQVLNAKAKDKPYKLTDGKGLHLLVKPNGGRYWRYKYTFLGKEKLLALGTYPEVSLSVAREKHREARKLVAEKIDPSAKKQEDKRQAIYNAQNSFELVAKEWFDLNKSKWSEGHAQRVWRRLEVNVVPYLGKIAIADIKTLDLLNILRKVEARGATEMAHRLLQSCNAIFRYAVITTRITYNPAQDLQGALKTHKTKHYPTIEAKELPDFFVQLNKVETTAINKIAIRLLMLTFIRTGELRKSKWENINWEEKEWRLPAYITKMKDEHVVPLPDQAIALLKELQQYSGHSELLFPSQQRRRHAMMSENTVNHVLHKMGYKGKLVGHGFRSLASTTLNEKGYRPDVIERQLAHAERNKVRAAYNRAEYMEQRIGMMQDWADFLDMQASEVQ